MDTRETAVHFYEVLTGVFNDDQSKIIRIVCFVVLLIGTMWAGYNYFRASLLADTETPLEDSYFDDMPVPRGNEAALQRMADLAQAIDSVRNGASAVAMSLQQMNRMPFNLDPEGNGGIDPMAALGVNRDDSPEAGTNTEMGATASQPAAQPGPIALKMIMTTNTGEKIAVIDAGGKKAVVVRRGDKLPGESGYVTKIKSNGITVRLNDKEYEYEVAELSRFSEIK